MNKNKIPGLNYPELSESVLTQMTKVIDRAEAKLGGNSPLVAEMERVTNRLTWEHFHEDKDLSAEEMAESASIPVELINEAIKFPQTVEEVNHVFKGYYVIS